MSEDEDHLSGEALPAGFWLRFGAQAIDCWLFVGGYIVCIFLVGLLKGLLRTGSGFVGLLALGALLALWAANACYHVYMTKDGAQTLGKWIMRIRVVGLDGEDIDAKRAFVRWLGYHLSCATLGAGYAAAGITPGKRALHDYAAGTRVVRLESVSAQKKAVGAALGILLLLLPLAGAMLARKGIEGIEAEQRVLREKGARLSLRVVRQALDEHRVVRGVPPKSLDEPGFVGGEGFLLSLPMLELPSTGHPPNGRVVTGAFRGADGKADPKVLKDSGGWAYDPSAGAVFVDCTHTDLRGEPVYGW